MVEKSYLTTRWLVMTGLALSGLLCVLASFVFQLDSLRVPIALYGYVSLGAWSYLTGHSSKTSRDFYLLPRAFAMFTIIFALLLWMLVDELELSEIGIMVIVAVGFACLALGLLHRPLAQTPEASIAAPSQT